MANKKRLFSVGNIARVALLTPVVVILLTLGWYQQAIQHTDIPENTIIKDDSYIIAGYFINWWVE